MQMIAVSTNSPRLSACDDYTLKKTCIYSGPSFAQESKPYICVQLVCRAALICLNHRPPQLGTLSAASSAPWLQLKIYTLHLTQSLRGCLGGAVHLACAFSHSQHSAYLFITQQHSQDKVKAKMCPIACIKLCIRKLAKGALQGEGHSFNKGSWVLPCVQLCKR